MRYLLKMIFNVAIGEDDTDGNMPGASITQEQADEIKKLIDDLAFEVDGPMQTMRRGSRCSSIT
jgi:hypothetical protein